MSHGRRTLRGMFVTAATLVSLALGAQAAQAAVTITSPSDGGYSNGQFAGTATNNGQDVSYSITPGGPSGTAGVTSNAWSFNAAAPAEGTYTLTVMQTVGGATSTATASFTYDITSPAASLTTVPAVTNQARPVITGTYGQASGDLAPVVTFTKGPATVQAAEEALFGGFSATPATDLDEGTWTVTVTQADLAGNVTQDSEPMIVDRAGPDVTVDAPSPNRTALRRPAITGTKSANDGVVAVAFTKGTDPPVPGTVTQTAAGTTWSAVPGSDLADGLWTVTATQADAAGNSDTASTTFTVDGIAPDPTVTPVSPDPTATGSGSVSGTRGDAPGDLPVSVVFTKDSDIVIGVVSQSANSWSATPASPLGEGLWTVTVTQSDEAGNSGDDSDSFTVDLTPPIATCDASLAAVACWNFDEPPGSVTADDSSPSDNDGTYLGGPLLGAAGVRNTAVSMDGVDDLVRVPDSNSLDVGDSFTLEGWIKRGSTAKTQQLFLKGGFQLTVMSAATGNQVFLRKPNVSTIVRSQTGVPADGAYHHVVATKNGPNSAKIYIDGVASTVNVSPAQIVPNSTSPMYLGATNSSPATFDEFAVYDQALTAERVLARYQAGAGAPAT